MKQPKCAWWILVILVTISEHHRRIEALVFGRPPVCNSQCAYEYVPVCGSDGLTYPNVCFLYVSSCTNIHLTYKRPGPCVVPDPCRIPCNRRYEPVCGTDGVTYTNPCVMMYSACVNFGQGIKQAYPGRCRNNTSGEGGTNSIGPTPPRLLPPGVNPSGCPIGCTREYVPVCGSDGVTYSNQCTFDMVACRDTTLKKVKDEACDESTRGGGGTLQPPAGSGPFSPSVPEGGDNPLRPSSGSNPFLPPATSGGGSSFRPSSIPDFAPPSANSGGGSSGRPFSGSGSSFPASNTLKCPLGCSQEYNPVCGSDGITYSNQCTFDSVACKDGRLYKVRDEPCGDEVVPPSNPRCPLSCNSVYEPVCGSNDVTYTNICHFNRASCADPTISKTKDEPCYPPPITTRRPSIITQQGPSFNDPRPSVPSSPPNQRPPPSSLPPRRPPFFSPTNTSPPPPFDQRPPLPPSTFGQRPPLPPSTSDQRPPTTPQRPPFSPSSPGTTGSRDFCRKDCPFTYSPLCGTDGVTYNNKCTFDVAVCIDSSLRLDYEGSCI